MRMAPASTSSQSWAYSSTTDRSTISRFSPFSDQGTTSSTQTSLYGAAGQQCDDSALGSLGLVLGQDEPGQLPPTQEWIDTWSTGLIQDPTEDFMAVAPRDDFSDPVGGQDEPAAPVNGPTNHARQRGSKVSKPRGGQRGRKNKFEWITITDPEQSKKPEVLQVVRRQAMNHSLEQSDNKLYHRRKARDQSDSAPQTKSQRGVHSRPSQRSTRASARAPMPYRQRVQQTQKQPSSPNQLVTAPHWPLANDQTPQQEPQIYFPFSTHGFGQDPFNSLPRPQNPLINVIKLKHNCVNFFSSEGLRKIWASRALDDRLFFFSALCIASRHEDALRSVTDSAHTLALETEVISMLNQTVLDPELQASDDTICTVMHLATAQNYRQEDTSFQWYDFMLSLIGKRGGFQGLTSFPALPWILTMNALGSSVIREVPPHPPFFGAAALQIHAARENPFILESPVCSPETGFAVIPYSQHTSEATSELLELMRRLTDTVTVDGHSRSAREQYMSQRDLVHMQLLNHKPADVPGHEASGDYIYESCRLAAVIVETALYNSTSFSGAVAGTDLTRQLKVALSKTPLETMWGDMAGVLLWVGFIGATAAHHSRERQSLVGVGTRTAIKHSFTHADSVIRNMYKLCQIQRFCAEGAISTPITA